MGAATARFRWARALARVVLRWQGVASWGLPSRPASHERGMEKSDRKGKEEEDEAETEEE